MIEQLAERKARGQVAELSIDCENKKQSRLESIGKLTFTNMLPHDQPMELDQGVNNTRNEMSCSNTF